MVNLILCASNCVSDVFFMIFLCSATHPVLSSLHKPITATEYYLQQKVNKKVAKSTGKVFVCVCVRLIHVHLHQIINVI